MNRTHGHAKGGKSPEYRAWHAMRQRCYHPSQPHYSRYGGRGIVVCERWQVFANFLADMGLRPSPRHSLDRINNSGNYEPGNCRWATLVEQCRNRRRRRDNLSGVTGVNWDAQSRKWLARIGSNGKTIRIGLFADRDAAIAARRAKAVELGFNLDADR